MGNCVLERKTKSNTMNFSSSQSIKHFTTAASIDSSCKGELQSPKSDYGDSCANWRMSPKFVSQIPVRTLPIKNSNLSKSTSFIRTSRSRIPVSLKSPFPIETVKPMKVLIQDFKTNQLNESGFVSDFSVTNSGSSQINVEPKIDAACPVIDLSDLDIAKHSKSQDLPIMEAKSFINNSSGSKNQNSKEYPISDIVLSLLSEQGKELSESYVRRPHSFSCESDFLVQQTIPKRSSTILREYSSILQEISQLKLMLHKLRRCLLQDNESINKPNCLSKPVTPINGDLTMQSKEELEHKMVQQVIKWGLLLKDSTCIDCRGRLTLFINKLKSEDLQWVCSNKISLRKQKRRNCGKRFDLRIGSFFSNSHLSMFQLTRKLIVRNVYLENLLECRNQMIKQLQKDLELKELISTNYSPKKVNGDNVDSPIIQ